MKRLAIVVLALAVSSCGYNRIQTLDEDINAYQGQIEAQLQRRYDLIPNLVETVRGIANQEQEVFTAIAESRARLGGAIESGDLGEMAAANQALGQGLGRLLAVVENYPDLRSSENFQMLQVQLEGTENRIATARQDYNNAVRDYNSYIRRFPQVLTAKVISAEAREYFEVSDEAAREAPAVSFD